MPVCKQSRCNRVRTPATPDENCTKVEETYHFTTGQCVHHHNKVNDTLRGSSVTRTARLQKYAGVPKQLQCEHCLFSHWRRACIACDISFLVRIPPSKRADVVLASSLLLPQRSLLDAVSLLSVPRSPSQLQVGQLLRQRESVTFLRDRGQQVEQGGDKYKAHGCSKHDYGLASFVSLATLPIQ